MTQEGNSDLSTKFSTLNVNAMEFVPSFCSSATSPAAPDVPAETSVDESVPAEAPSSPTKTDEEQPISIAAPTESIDDKSPDNPGW